MKRHVLTGLVASILMAAAGTTASAQSTAITYQGQLKSGGLPVSSPADLRFSLFTAASGGTQLGSTVTQSNVTVTEGLFTTPIDFGFNPYTSGNQNTFLQIEVRNPAGVGAFVPLGTRQPLTAAPFSLATRGLNVDASANVGIGGTAPRAKLEVSDGIGSDPMRLGTVQITRPDNITGSHLAFIRSGFNATGLGYRAQGSNAFGFGDTQASTAFTPNWLAIDTVTRNVGIGTVAPIARFEVVTLPSPLNDPVAIFRNQTCGEPCAQELNTENIRLVNTAPSGSVGIGLMVEPDATINSLSDVWLGTGFGSGTDDNNFIIATKTNPTTLTKRVVVNGDSGNVGIGTDTPQARLHNVGVTRLDDRLQFGATLQSGNTVSLRRADGANGAAVVLDISPATVANNSAFIIDRNGNGVFLFQLDGVAAKPGGGTWAALSDERSKNDIQPMTGTLERLLRLKGHAYTYKPEFVENGRALPGMQIGLVAQEVETVFPDWVSTGADGMKHVTERSTTALMVEALRDLRTEKDAEINALKARLDKLEALLAAQASVK